MRPLAKKRIHIGSDAPHRHRQCRSLGGVTALAPGRFRVVRYLRGWLTGVAPGGAIWVGVPTACRDGGQAPTHISNGTAER